MIQPIKVETSVDINMLGGKKKVTRALMCNKQTGF